MTPYEIPLTGVPQTFLFTMLGVQYRLTVRWQNSANNPSWTLDIALPNGTLLVCGIPLVTGANLLAQYAYLGIGVGLYVATDGNLAAVPTFRNLGVGGARLYFTTTP